MAIGIVPQSAAMTITQQPTFQLPYLFGTAAVPFNPSKAGMQFQNTQLRADCQCQITGLPIDNPAGWTLGVIQLLWVTTNWAYYRGQNNGDGDCFLQYTRPPARPAQACRDTVAPWEIFVDLKPFNKTVAQVGQPFPITMKAVLEDRPVITYPFTRVNSLTGNYNFLREVQIEWHFCTVLSLRNPEPLRGAVSGTYHHLKHFFWNLHWHAQFEPTNYADVTKLWTITKMGGSMGNSANVSRVFDCGPTDPKFTNIITAPATPICKIVGLNAQKHPNMQESAVWQNYDVRR
jgi:hypothetical protein